MVIMFVSSVYSISIVPVGELLGAAAGDVDGEDGGKFDMKFCSTYTRATCT